MIDFTTLSMTEIIRLQVLPGPPPDLAISVNVDKTQVDVGEYAIFIVTVTNRAAQPACSGRSARARGLARSASS